jgi:hypothetical protein
MGNSPPFRYSICAARRLIVVTLVVTIVLAYFAYPYWNGARSVRFVMIEKNLFKPKTMTPFRSVAIRSDEELQEVIANLWNGMKPFLDDKETEGYWRDSCDTFESAIKAAEVDFAKESLILIPHPAGSGSITVGLSRPWLRSKTLVCTVWRHVPSVCTMDMAYHCFALVVQNDKVDDVEVWAHGQRETLSLAKKNAD